MEELTIKNPWLGLESYKEGEVLYGRDDDIRDLSQCVLNDIDTLLYGKSGIGKSSILNAGIIPAARRHGYLPVLVRLSHKEMLTYLYQIKDSIANAMIPIPLDKYGNLIKLTTKEQQQRDAELKKRIVKVVDCKDTEKESLYEYFHRHTFHDAEGRRIKLLIIFDQFEEFFTLQSDEPTKKRFFAELADLLNDKIPEGLQKSTVIQHDGMQQAKIKDDDDFDAIFNDIDIGDKSDIDNIDNYVNDNEIHFVFTIREDFLSEFEYYSASIPSLKQNRYGLRPINKEQAAQIIMRPVPGLIDESVAKLIIEKVTGKAEIKLDGIPEFEVDSAVLSLYLKRLYEAKTCDKITAELVEAKDAEIIADFYKDAISSISNSTIEYLEDKLLDGKGRRDNITITDAMDYGGATESELDILIEKKKILHRFNYAGALRIEYVHDILCPVVKANKKERISLKKLEEEHEKAEKARKQAEETKKREEQRVNTTSLVLLSLALLFIIWFINAVFGDPETLRSLISETLTNETLTNENETISTSAYKISSFNFYVFAVSLANLSIIPILIYSSVKRLNLTSWLSVYALISNILLMFLFIFGQYSEMSLRTGFAVIVLLVPTLTLYYSINEHLYGFPNKQEIWTVVKSAPLKYFNLILSLYLFYICVFNRALGLAEPFNSSWAVIVIPLLTHEIIRNSFGHKQKTNAFFILCLLLLVMTYNTFVVPFALPFYAVVCILGMTMGVIIWSFWGLTWGKKTIAIATDILVLTLVVILNMGFNVFKVKYDSVSHVFNWVDVLVHDDDNHFGVVSACSGDTILPCAFDSINYRQHYCFLSSNKISYKKDMTDFKGLFTYKKSTNTAMWQCLFIDEVENNILKYNSSTPDTLRALREDSIRVYAARVYHEVRKANIKYFTSGKMYPLDDVKSIDSLIELQKMELANILNEFSNSSSTISSKPLNITQVVAFNKAFARSFYLCMLKDRILQKDSINLFTLPQEIISLYFSDTSDFELITISMRNINIYDFRNTYSLMIKVSDLRNNILDSWYNYVNMLLAMDMGSNVEEYLDHKVRRYTDILNNMFSANEQQKQYLDKISKLIQRKENLKVGELEEALALYEKQFVLANDMKMKTYIQIDSIELKKQMDIDFQRLINDVFTALSHVVNHSQNIYNSAFVDICEQLFMISVLRQYKIAPIYLGCLENKDNAKNKFYLEFNKLLEREDSIKRKVKDFRF